MRKSIAFLLAICLFLGLANAALATSFDIVSAEAPGEDTTYAQSAALYQGRLLVLRSDGLYEVTQDSGQMNLILKMNTRRSMDDEEAFTIHSLLAEGDQLYGYDQMKGVLYPLTLVENQLTPGNGVELDMSRHVEDGVEDMEQVYLSGPEQMALQDGRLYMLFRDYMQDGQNTSLSSFDLKTGQEKAYQSPFILRMAGYKDGKLLVMTLDEENSWDPVKQEQIPPTLGVFDPETDSVTEISQLKLPYRGDGHQLAYDQDRDMIYLLMPNKLYQVDQNGQEELAAYLPTSSFFGVPAGLLTVLGKGRVAVTCNAGVFLREADPSKLPATTLTIYGGYEDTAHKKAALQMPGVPITFLDDKWFSKATELGQALVSGEDNIDVLVLEGSYFDLQTLMQKGYTQDLSGSPKLTEYVNTLYPKMQEAARMDGKLLLVPVGANLGEMLRCDTKLFEETGLPIPHTFSDLCQLITDWAQGKADEFPDYQLMTQFEYRRSIAYMMVTTYMDQLAYQGQDLRFDTPEFRQMAKDLENMDVGDLEREIDWSDPNSRAQLDEMFEKKTLMERYGGIDISSLDARYEKDARYLQLKPYEGAPEVTKIQLRFLAVNPRSKNIDLAIQFVEHYVASLEESSRAMLDPSRNEPLLNPYYDQMLKSREEYINTLTKQIEKAEGAEKAELESNLESYQKNWEDEKESARYLVTEKGIKAYRALMENYYIATYQDGILWNNQEIQPILQRYLEKQITLDQFIQEADGKLRLIQLENQ